MRPPIGSPTQWELEGIHRIAGIYKAKTQGRGRIESMAIALQWGQQHGQAVSPQPYLGDRPCSRVQRDDSRVQLADQSRERSVGQTQGVGAGLQNRRRGTVQVG